MCLVCLINAEETRSHQKDDINISLFNGNATSCCPMIPQAVHYFAIGSMTNMTAMSLRELSPISSSPAILTNYRMLFRGSGGMATVEKVDEVEKHTNDAENYPFDGIHGVLHLLTTSHMKMLDDFEGGYHRIPCVVKLYNGKLVNSFVYQMDRSKWIDNDHHLPTERYLDIIAQGCLSHRVDCKWVNFIRNHNCIKRKSSTEFSSFNMTTAVVPILSWEEISKCNGIHDERLWIVINNKVLEFSGDKKSFFPYGYFVKSKLGGTDFTIRFAKGFYEPKYKINNEICSSNELEVEHRSWIEDQFANPPPVLAGSQWQMVGVVTTDFIRNFSIRKAKSIESSEADIDFSEYINNGYNQFFINGTYISKWIFPDGVYIGQTLYIRKTAVVNYSSDIIINIRNQSLSSPNIQSQCFIMKPNIYSLSWVWNGYRWFLESSISIN